MRHIANVDENAATGPWHSFADKELYDHAAASGASAFICDTRK